MEVYINHSGGLHKLKYEIEFPNDRIKKERKHSKNIFYHTRFYYRY